MDKGQHPATRHGRRQKVLQGLADRKCFERALALATLPTWIGCTTQTSVWMVIRVLISADCNTPAKVLRKRFLLLPQRNRLIGTGLPSVRKLTSELRCSSRTCPLRCNWNISPASVQQFTMLVLQSAYPTHRNKVKAKKKNGISPSNGRDFCFVRTHQASKISKCASEQDKGGEKGF